MAKKPSKGNGNPISKIEIKLELSREQGKELLKILQVRFEKNMHRHKGLEWPKLQAKLESQPEKLSSLNAMESTGGEPDVVGYDIRTGEYIFYDCSAESPTGRRSICYDGDGQKEREKKGVYPAGPSLATAATTMSLSFITARPPSMPPGDSEARSGSEPGPEECGRCPPWDGFCPENGFAFWLLPAKTPRICL